MIRKIRAKGKSRCGGCALLVEKDVAEIVFQVGLAHRSYHPQCVQDVLNIPWDFIVAKAHRRRRGNAIPVVRS